MFFKLSSFVKPFENNWIEFRDFFLTSWYSFLHCHKRLYDEWKLKFYFIQDSLNLLRQFLNIFCWSCLISFFINLLFAGILLNWWLNLCLLLTGFDWLFGLGLRFRLCCFLCLYKWYGLSLFGLKISLPQHDNRISPRSSKVITIFWETTWIDPTVMPIYSVLQLTFHRIP